MPFPIITQEIQQLYEIKHKHSEDNTPLTCGYYGRGCRCMNTKADHMHCIDCELSLFAEKYYQENSYEK